MESRNLITAREMVSEGNWLIPTMNGELRLENSGDLFSGQSDASTFDGWRGCRVVGPVHRIIGVSHDPQPDLRIFGCRVALYIV